MMAFPSMLVNPAKKAGIPVPEDPDNFDRDAFQRFHLFCLAQLGQSMPYPDCVWGNARVIAAIPEEELKKVSFANLIERGYAIGNSSCME